MYPECKETLEKARADYEKAYSLLQYVDACEAISQTVYSGLQSALDSIPVLLDLIKDLQSDVKALSAASKRIDKVLEHLDALIAQ